MKTPRYLLPVLCSCPLWYLAPAQAQTLEQVLDQVMAGHPKVKASLATQRSVAYEIDQAKAGKAPKFGLIADPGISYGEGYRDAQGRKKTTDTGDLGVRSTYLLYDAQRTNHEIARQQARLQTTQAKTDQTYEGLINQITESYLEVLKQERLEKLAQDNLAAHHRLRQKVQGIADLDRGRQYDLVQVQARTSQAQVTLSSRQGSTQEAKAILAELAGGPVATLTLPRDPSAMLPPDQPSALVKLDEHPNLRAAQADVEVAQRASAVAANADKPRVDLQTTVNSPKNFENDRKYFSNLDVRLAVQWQPFDGGAAKASANSATQLLLAARDNVAAVRKDLANEVTRYWSQIASRQGRSQAFNELATQLEKVRDNQWQQFTIGKRSILDLLNTENEVFQARLNAEQERFETLQAQYRLLGGLAQTSAFLGINRPHPVTAADTQPRPTP